MSIQLTIPPKRELKPRIVVFGVGGAGGNAVNNMVAAGLEGVDFVVANTDAQALTGSDADRRIQIGAKLTEGLGAGSDPAIGKAAAEETMAEIVDMLQGSHMAFVTAGMGGGTGTGAAPVIARAAREQGILTVGVVTKPFDFEGSRRMRSANDGIEALTKEVDTLIIIPNQNLFRIANAQTTFAEAFAMADEVLHSGVAGITDLMIKPGLINLDFADVRTVMNEMGKAMMGTGDAEGDKRAIDAAEAAIANPLLDDVSMRGARGVLINITGGDDMTLYEVDEAANRIREEVDSEANIIIGSTFDDALRGTMRVSVVATGIEAETMGLRTPDGGQVIPMTNTEPASQPADPTSVGVSDEAEIAAFEEAPDMAPQPVGEAPDAAAGDLPSFLAGQHAAKPVQPQISKRKRSFIDRVFGAKKGNEPEQSAAAMPRIVMSETQVPVTTEPSKVPSAPLDIAEIVPPTPQAEVAQAAPLEEAAFLEELDGVVEAPAASAENAAPETVMQAEPQVEAPVENAAPEVSAPSADIANPDIASTRPMVQTSMDTGPTIVSPSFEGDQLDIPAFLRR